MKKTFFDICGVRIYNKSSTEAVKFGKNDTINTYFESYILVNSMFFINFAR